MADLYERRQIVARRQHKCHLCGEIIPPGVWYIREKWHDDGFSEVKRHIHCDALLDEIFKSEHYTVYEYTDDDVWGWIRDKCLELCGYEKRNCDCDKSPYSCGVMIGIITNSNSRKAAEESLMNCNI